MDSRARMYVCIHVCVRDAAANLTLIPVAIVLCPSILHL